MARRDLGGGFRLVASPDAGPSARLVAGFTPRGWQARQPGSALSAPFPGTGLLIDDRWYEIVRATAGEGETVFDLEPWDDANVFRQTFEVTPETCRRLHAEHLEAAERARRGQWLAAFSVLTGLLPAGDQRRLEREYGVLATRATAVSALVFLSLGAFLCICALAIRFGHHFGALHPPLALLARLWPLWLYLALESYARLRSAWQAGEPLGSLPVALPVLLLRGLRRRSRPRPADERAADRSWRAAAPGFATARDRVRALPETSPGRPRLEVVSALPKEHWTAGITGIRYGETMYLLEEREVVDGDGGPRHRFVLEAAPEETVFRAACDYRPEEVREIYRESRRRRAATWVGTLAMFWGLLDEDLQRALERGYDYRPLSFTRGTIFLAAIVGIYNLLASLARGAGPDGGPADLVVFLSGVFLLGESILRWRALRAGRLRGSLLGLPFAPLARRALRWLPEEDR